MTTDRAVARFWGKVSQGSGCWLWRGGRGRDGYGKFSVGYDDVRAHRFSWELHHGPIPAGMSVLHRCDVRARVNPGHLFLGTNAENMADKVSKGRQARGDAHGSRLHPERLRRGIQHHAAKLTQTQAEAIRARRRAGERLAVLAGEFGVSESLVSRIGLGKNWASP